MPSEMFAAPLFNVRPPPRTANLTSSWDTALIATATSALLVGEIMQVGECSAA